MGKRNRARTRAIRAEMAKTGENYTRVAAAVGGSSTWRGDRSSTDVVKEHIVRILQERVRVDEARYDLAVDLNRRGHRVIFERRTSGDGWEIRDWLTDELLAEGDDGHDGYAATVKRLDPDDMWYHEDFLDDEEPLQTVTTLGMPPTLGQAIDDWVAQLSTSDEEIAQFIGWSVEKVREHR
ncbi:MULTISPECIES: hypothetical protein [Micromonospora]|uniref:hypothetical protein n=1 Tax=Micromonospora TaxID=1873 RepID=UPI0003EECB9D|nr:MULTISPECIES: hypothetical protein [Micromonospora]NED50414.1 hypothetical protein [Micromonospora aurantiaca]EWM65076.1 hypothetical protein MCBG_02209 [Micromonospora sp. M42]MBC8992752.1 hypothetical protein [Micromonospora chalcea]MBQ1067020.1 hypothetical protein [Micromonospora sp. D75]MCK1807265.1 hypothetical protein [Micromonospora sp. R42106]